MKRHGDIIVVDEHHLLHVAGIFKVEDPHIVGIADGAAYAVGVKVVARVVVYLGKKRQQSLVGQHPFGVHLGQLAQVQLAHKHIGHVVALKVLVHGIVKSAWQVGVAPEARCAGGQGLVNGR